MKGYLALTALMLRYPRLGIFRCFRKLTILNLLLYQAELLELEFDLRNLDGPSFQFSFLDAFAAPGDGQPNLRRGVMLKIRPLLKEFHESLLRATTVNRMVPPSASDNLALRTFLQSERERFPDFLYGLESTTWAEEYESDMVSLAPAPSDNDALARWIDTRFIPWYHDKIGHLHKSRISEPESGTSDSELEGRGRGEARALPLHDYPDKRVSKFARITSTTMSSLCPNLSILILHIVHSPRARIVLITIFTMLFSLTVVLTTTARKVDIFVSTSAFAAVMVVFINGGSMVDVHSGEND